MHVAHDEFASYKLVRDQLIERGYVAREFLAQQRRYVELTSPDGMIWVTQAARIAYPMRTAAFTMISHDKDKGYETAQRLGLNIPATYVIAADESLDVSRLDAMLAAHHKLIVKPVRASLSHGLTLSITTREQLQEAIAFGRTYHESVLVQEQIEGEELRFMVVGDKVVGALLRQTPRVVGDGVRTVAELIRDENEQRKHIDTPYVTYPLLTSDNIPAEYIESTKVLSTGEILELNRATMIKNGCSVYNVTEQVHPDYLEAVERLAQEVGIGFGCVDIFCQDYTQSATVSNYWFMEVNTSPVLKLCYGVRDGNQLDIVPLLAAEIDAHLTRAGQQEPKVFGTIERVHLPEFNVYGIEAKIDTGAYSGALHCTKTLLVRRKDGTRVLRFTPSDTGVAHETTRYKSVYVRSASGHRSRRYVIETEIIIRGQKYPITIGLSNRKDMQKEILIGRRFLREHGILVDVRINQELDNDGGGKI